MIGTSSTRIRDQSGGECHGNILLEFTESIASCYNARKEVFAMSNAIAESALSVLVPLPSELARKIDYLAERRGQDRAQFIVSFLQEQLNGSARSFEESIAPIAEDFRRSGMTEEELDALVEQERQAIWDEKNQ
jgi:hypothetical protein